MREVEHLDFVEAVERLAARAGITLRYDDKAVAKDRSRRDRLVAAVAEAIDFYHRLLLDSADGGTRARLPARRAGSTATTRVSSSSAGRRTRSTA